MKVVVIGSSNIDMVAQVSHLPAPGETVGDANFMQSLGGKGANQAVAAARLGGSVTFVTSLGNDMYADILKNHFKKEGITTDYIIDDVNHPTGTALIFVAHSGENCIAVAPGANYSLLPGSITHFSEVIDEADIIVMQAEIPYETIKKIALSAKQKGKKVLFNPAPACLIDEELMKAIDILVVNELEASFISGIEYTDNNLEKIAETLLKAGTSNVVITLGSQGVYMKNVKETIQLSGCKVNAIDTIAAGDTFCGALAVVCAKKEIDQEALNFANTAAAIAVTRSADMREEEKRKVRIAAGGLQSIWRLRPLLNPFRYGILSFQYTSHRVLRWSITPFLLFALFPLNIAILLLGGSTIFYGMLLAMQVLFYGLGYWGYYLSTKQIKNKLLFIPYYFLFMNVNVLKGIRYLKKKKGSGAWEKAKRAEK